MRRLSKERIDCPYGENPTFVRSRSIPQRSVDSSTGHEPARPDFKNPTGDLRELHKYLRAHPYRRKIN